MGKRLVRKLPDTLKIGIMNKHSNAIRCLKTVKPMYVITCCSLNATRINIVCYIVQKSVASAIIVQL